MAAAYAMEREAFERYTQFADRLQADKKREVASLFRELAAVEKLHAQRILDAMGWTRPPQPPAAFAWHGAEGPETPPFDRLQSLTHPYLALEMALRCENQAQKYFERIAASAAPQAVRAAAAEMAAEEREHAKLLHLWLAKVPRPLDGWD